MKEKSSAILLTCIIKSLPYLWRSFTNHQKITSQCQWDGFHPRLILVWMPLEGQLSVCLFDAIKLCIIGDAQYLSKHQWFNMLILVHRSLVWNTMFMLIVGLINCWYRFYMKTNSGKLTLFGIEWVTLLTVPCSSLATCHPWRQATRCGYQVTSCRKVMLAKFADMA